MIQVDANNLLSIIDKNCLIRELNKRKKKRITKRIIKSTEPKPDKILIYYKDIINIVLNYYDTNPEILTIESSEMKYVKVKQIIAYFLREYTYFTLRGIGELLNRKHCTVIHSINIVNNECFTKSEYLREIKEIRGRLIKHHAEDKKLPLYYIVMSISDKQLRN